MIYYTAFNIDKLWFLKPKLNQDWFFVPKKNLCSYGPVKYDNSLADWFTKKCVVSMSNEHLIHIHSTLVKIHRHRIWDFCICNSTAFSLPFLKSYDLACLGKVSAKERVRKRHTQCSAGTPWFKKRKVIKIHLVRIYFLILWTFFNL